MPKVFLSYASIDNEILHGCDHGWVATFHKTLQNKLDQQFGRRSECVLWMDYELRGNDEVSPKIREHVTNSDAFLCLLSNSYLRSSWCRYELESFSKRSSHGQSNVFVVLLQNKEEMENIPEKISGSVEYKLYERDPSNKRTRLLGYPAPNPLHPDYYSRIDDLANDIASFLKGQQPSRTPGDAIFVNGANRDLDLVRQTIAALEAKGAKCIRPKTLDMTSISPKTISEHQRKMLKECSSILVVFKDGPEKELRQFMMEYKKINVRRQRQAQIFICCPDNSLVSKDYDVTRYPCTAARCAEDCAEFLFRTLSNDRDR